MQATERKDPHPGDHLQAGDALGRYQLLCPIARGGMGQVWAARQTGRLGLPKLVAIKTAIPMESKDYRQVEKYLLDEAHVAASIDHPNVCKILELGQERDVLFIAMEWLNGVPLSSLISKLPQRRLSYRMAAHLVAQACSGLHAAHELTDDDGVHLDVVHRDATPHNLMITSMGELKVMDFGIVKAKNQQHQATQTGELKGKISYLTPEQIRGGTVDRRTDIFTLGCVLYVTTAGKVAFNPDTDQDAGRTMLKILYGDYTAPSAILPDYPPELEVIVQRALATAPADRFQSAEEMRLALEGFLGDGSRSVTREDVAALLNEYCGPIIEQRRQDIRTAQKLFDSQSGQMRSGSYPVADRAFAMSSPLVFEAQGNAGSMQWSRSSPLAPTIRPSKGRRKRLWMTLAGAGLAVASFGAMALRQPDHHGRQPALAKPAVQEVDRARPAAPSARPSETPAPAAGSLVPPASPEPDRVQLEPSNSSVSAPGTARRAGTHRTSARTTGTAAESRPVASDATSAPASSNSQFSQTLSRQPPRHAIDESDPFQK